jgi:superfamily II DNA/RNA helicase
VGEALTFVAPEDEGDLARIERTLGSKLPRVTLDGFAYRTETGTPLEVPRAERVAAIRKRNGKAHAVTKGRRWVRRP